MTIAILIGGSSAWAQVVQENFWVTNGDVNAVVREGNTVYIGGSFTRVEPITGGGTGLNNVSGTTDGTFPRVNGNVFVVVSDGTDGWYIGGFFTAVGGVARNNIAHIKADKSVDLMWNPNANGNVTALAVSGTTVYAGGEFTTIGGQSRNRIAALDALVNTNNATLWNPNADNGVLALAVSGTTVYAGGTFTTIGGQTRNNIAALDATTGNATAWNPNANNFVSALAVSGTTVYAGGGFTAIGGQTRNNIAALDADLNTNNATAWNPTANATVLALAVSGTTVYAGGGFGTIGGAARNRIAALDATSGLATAWDPNANNTVFALAVSGTTVYAGGQFTTIGGQTRNRIAALDALVNTNNATLWNPNADNGVLALAVSGTTVYAGGFFTTIGGQTRNRIAALDALVNTNNATLWNPNANLTVSALAVSGTTVYAGGLFTTIGGQPRNRIAALDALVNTNNATAWNPNANSQVNGLAVSGGTVYAGGNFTTIGGQGRNFIAALDATTGLATLWNPDASGQVLDLAVSGTTVYAGGQFNTIGGQSRSNIAALSIVAAPAAPTALSTANGSTTQVPSWTAGTGSVGTLVVRSAAGGTLSGTPADGTAYTVGQSLLGGTVAFVGSATAFTETLLAPASTYQYQLFGFDGTNTYSVATTTNGTTLTPSANSAVEVFDAGFTGALTQVGVTVTFTAPAGVAGTITLTRNLTAPSAATFPASPVSTSGGSVTIDRVSPDRFWNIVSPATGAYTVSLDVAGLGNAPTPNRLAILKRPDGGTTWTGLTTTYSAGLQTLTASTSGFSDFGIGGGSVDNPLPVTLNGFTGSASQSGVVLNWKTASETDNAGFSILRDGAVIAGYENVNTLRGKGTTTNASSYAFTDATVEAGQVYTYKLRSHDLSGAVYDYPASVSVEVRETPVVRYEYALSQNYPNPFNPQTMIEFTMKQAGIATLTVTDMLGRTVSSETLNAVAGVNQYRFNGSRLTSGVYFYQLTVLGSSGSVLGSSGSQAAFSQTRKMLLVK